MGTASTKSKDKMNKINASLDESAEYDFKLNFLKNSDNNAQSVYQSDTTQNTKKAELNDLVPHKFEWLEGGTNVKISGSFLDDWRREEPMIFNSENNIYEITLNVPRGKNQFKFIINNKWVCSKHYEIVNDNNNNQNNEIIISTNPENNNTNNTTYSSNILEIKNSKKKLSKGNNDYNCNYPLESFVNKEAPIIPLHYKPYINFDFNQNQGNKDKDEDESKEKSDDKKEEPQLLDNHKNRFLLENNTFKSTLTIPHEKLSHLLYNHDSDDKYIRIALSQRSKHKFLTVVYFSPKI